MSSRRSFLGNLLRAGALLPLAGAAAQAKPIRPINASPANELAPITPEEWFAELRRIGWSANAGVDRHGLPVCVIEWAPKGEDGLSDDRAFGVAQVDRYRLCSRAARSGPDFWKRTAQWLFDQGLTEPLRRSRNTV